MNAGVYGYSSFQGVRRLRQCLGFDPDVVLIGFGGNDGHPVGVSDAGYGRRLSQRQGLLRMMTLLRVGQLLLDASDKLHALASPTAPASRRVELPEYRENLLEMIRMCRARGALPVLVTRPFLGHTQDPESWKSVGPEYNQETREVGLGEGVLVVDLYAKFKRRRDMFEDESHFTDKGHWEAAAYVGEQLAPVLAERAGTR